MSWIVTDLAAAVGLFTRLPVGGLLGPNVVISAARGVWAYPVAGAAIGAAGGGVHALALLCGMPAALAACWTLAALLLLTGALHEDGLADTADGFGGGRDAARKLEIMRDSRIGSYGALALGVSLAMRGAAIASLAGAWPVAAALVVAGALGRAGLVLPLLLARPARSDGLAAALVGIPARSAAAVGAIAIAIALLLLPGGTAALALALALLGGGAMTWLTRRQIGGYSGDVLGATELAIECGVLTLLAARPG